MKGRSTRSEQEVFEEIASLCASPGYIHTVAYLCFRDNVIHCGDELTEEDMHEMFSLTRLIRTEITTLIGLMIKVKIDYTIPAPSTFQKYIEDTDRLLNELHEAISRTMMLGAVARESLSDAAFNPLSRGAALREPIFYGGESAYVFQYRDLAVKKYAADREWLESNKGFYIEAARTIVRAIEQIQSEKLRATLSGFKAAHPDQWTILPGFAFSTLEVATAAGIDKEQVERMLLAFALPDDEKNTGFNALDDYNVVDATPLLRMPDGLYLSLQTYALAQSLYESPFYWMTKDAAYLSRAMANRGKFTESFAHERLLQVFGQVRTFANVDIYESKSTKIGEIDVLVVFGDRAIVVQAKSKRLTLEARRGNDQIIRDDFKKSVQDAYDQAFQCAKCLGDKHYIFKSADGRIVELPNRLKEVYIFCVVSDHYPALSFQARQFLRSEHEGCVQPPLILDVFTLDAMSEMLQSPLQFLSYVNRRSNYADRLHASHELTILGYHLKHNLWFDDEMQLISLGDDFSAGLDVAMAVRRDGVSGGATPEGILTRLTTTAVGRIVGEIESRPDPATIDLGFMLLTLSEYTIKEIDRGIRAISARARADGKCHDLTLGFPSHGCGLTIHCNEDVSGIAGPRLALHCRRRKYTEKANAWFGLCLHPKDSSLRFGINMDYDWVQNGAMDIETREMKSGSTSVAEAMTSLQRRPKLGRNDPCPCGSGIKYKKCCLGKRQ